MDWEGKGIKINGRKLSNLRFADDLIIFAGSVEELEIMIAELCAAFKKLV